MKELETRIIDIDVEKIRETLNKLGAKNVKRENQTNDIFDFPDRKLLDKKGYARISNKNIINEISNIINKECNGIKFEATFDNDQQMLIIDLNKPI